MSPFREEAARRAEEGSKPRGKRTAFRTSQATSPASYRSPLSPQGRHAGLRTLLLEVGNALSRDEENWLSRVSLFDLRVALSTFVRVAGQEERASFEAGTSRPTRSQPAGVSGESTQARERRMRRLKKKSIDDTIIARLKAAQAPKQERLDGF